MTLSKLDPNLSGRMRHGARAAAAGEQARVPAGSPEGGQFGEGGGAGADAVSGAKAAWTFEGSSVAITHAAASMTGAEGWYGDDSDAQANDLARDLLDGINQSPETDSPTYSGHSRLTDTTPEPGDEMDIPVMAVSDDRELAEAYANQSELAHRYPADVRSSSPEDLRTLERIMPQVLRAPGDKQSASVVYEFRAGAPALNIRENEQLVSGRFAVADVHQGEAIGERYVTDSHSFEPTHRTIVELEYRGPLERHG